MTSPYFSSFMFSPEDKITIRFIDDTKKAPPSQAYYGTIEELTPIIKEKNKKDYAAFFAVNHIGSNSTLDKDVKYARAIFIDIDGGELPEYFPCKPSYIVSREGGGGHHVYWTLDKPCTDLTAWRAAQSAFISFYRSDETIKNPARIMRIPGTMNHKLNKEGNPKYGTPSPKYEVVEDNNLVYSFNDLLLSHTSQKESRSEAVHKARELFPEGKIKEGEGRHKLLIRAGYILNDYGISADDAFTALKNIVRDKFEEPIDDEKIRDYVVAQKTAKGEKGSAVVNKEKIQQMKIDRAMEVLSGWYYVRHDDAFFKEGSSRPVSVSGFNAKFAKVCGDSNVAKFAFKHDCVKQYEQFTYIPAEDIDIEDNNGLVRNMYVPSKLEPIDRTPDWFLSHLEYLIADEKERKHFIQYLAHLVQRPAEKIRHGCLIVGKPGIGKSLLHSVFIKLFGASNISTPHNENLSGSFTGWAKQCCLVVIHELFQDDKKDFNNKIKPFITEDTVEIREMYTRAYTIPNYMHIIAFSNKDAALYLEEDDRRWFIVKAEVDIKPHDYYLGMIETIKKRSGEVLHYLQNVDLSDFRAGAKPPDTKGKREMIEESRPEIETWITEGIADEESPFNSDYVTLSDVYASVPESLKSRFVTAKRIGKILKKLGAVRLPQVRTADGIKRFWVIRNFEKYATADAVDKVQTELTDNAESFQNNLNS